MAKSVLDRVRVRLATPREGKRFKRLMARHHYLGWSRPVGETLDYVAHVGGRWVALLSFGAGAYALRGRDEWIGWTAMQRRGRLNFLTQNRRFLVLPGKWRAHVLPAEPAHLLRGEEHYSLFQALPSLPDGRSAHGRRHRQASVLACAACAFLAGVEGIGEMAEFAASLDQRHLRLLRCWRDRGTGRCVAPSESTFRRVLGSVDATLFDAAVAAWVRQHERLVALAVDGKTLKACRDAEGHQPNLLAHAERLLPQAVFSPSDGHGRKGARPRGDAPDPMPPSGS